MICYGLLIMKYIIVDSVKGGCGKSSVALRTAIQLARENKKNRVLVIDMDIMGSSLECFVTGKLSFVENDNQDTTATSTSSSIKIGEEDISDKAIWLTKEESESDKSGSKEKCYFTDLFYKRYDTSKIRPIEKAFKICEKDMPETENINIYIAFSSPEQKIKNYFRFQKSTNFQMNVNIRYYEEILGKYIEDINTKYFDNEFLTHIIFDMPPNSDPYSDCIFSILLNKLAQNKSKKSGKDVDDSVELMLVSSCDMSHINANIEWVVDLYRKNGWTKAFPSILHFVVNQLYPASRTGVLLNSSNIDENIKNSIMEKIQGLLSQSEFIDYKNEKNNLKIKWIPTDDILYLTSIHESCIAFSKSFFYEHINEKTENTTESKDERITN